MDSEPQPKTRKSVSWRRVGITLLLIFAALWLVYPATMHVMVWYYAQREARGPIASLTPQPLPELGIADLSHGADATAFGYSLRFPWPIRKQDSGRKVVSWYLADGVNAAAFDESGDSMGPGLLVNATPREAATYKSVYGERALSSKYEFLKAELSTTAADVSFWHSRSLNAGAMSRLMLKPGPLLESKALYAVAEGEMRGFQFGDPARSRTVTIMLFDPSDRETWLLLHRGPEATWTQTQINAVIASIHPAQ